MKHSILLIIRDAGVPQRLVPVLEQLIVGRHPAADLVLKSPSVSRFHASIIRRDDNYMLLDLDSANGTLVNDCAVDSDEPRVLCNGDVICFGDVTARVVAVGQKTQPSEQSNRESHATDLAI